MEWTEAITRTIAYMEDHLTEELTVQIIADQVHLSPFYFQKGFVILCGYTPSEYIRNRRLTEAARELAAGCEKVIDIALKYGYESPDSFTKAFVRFHGCTPAEMRGGSKKPRIFAPLRVHFQLKGGFRMDYRIVDKPEFKVIGCSKLIPFGEGMAQCPAFWDEHMASGRGKTVVGEYAVCFDEAMDGKVFKYMIADAYAPEKELPGFEAVTIPAYTWAVFPCIGPMPRVLQETTERIFSEWLPQNKEYEIAAGISVEYYHDPMDYPQGTKDEAYYCEVWVPVKRK
ncbi:MAG: AraC family transcriptional regulator [Clostridia bacterium]|nr:AraC family transcriptional regulator [Clostridia bacterium]